MKKRIKKESKEKDLKNQEKNSGELKNQEKQLKMLLFIAVFIIAAVILFYLIAIESKKFDYLDLKFKKIKQGKINFYYTEFPIRDTEGNVVNGVGFYFREDPRKLKDIEINGKIQLKQNVALVPDSSILKCEDNGLVAMSLVTFLAKSGINPVIGTMNKTEAEMNNRLYVNCSNTKTQSIVIFNEGERNYINRDGDCYRISVANCEIMDVAERFMMGLYAHSRGMQV